jgi:hypothetical protein
LKTKEDVIDRVGQGGMMMVLKLIKKSPTEYGCWECEEESGKSHTVDLCIDKPSIDAFLKEGVIVEVEYLQPYVEIGVGVVVK